MSLHPGTTLGSYEIVDAIGAGGMGEVYRARDTKLGREVAIKVLPEGLSDDADRMVRFEREAKALAALNHPNVATLYGFETALPDRGAAGTGPAATAGEEHVAAGPVPAVPAGSPIPFLVMELVPGETLGERLESGPLPVDEAVPIFLQIAEGLEAAHDQGVVHRDLKPANIKVTEEGPGTPERVKILDFGLAKALAPEELSGSTGLAGSGGSVGTSLAESPTLTYMATMRGEILGTAAYMSPEQARGKSIDRRTDIWAFGACLWEALTGERLFQGETPTDIIAQVVTKDPDFDSLPQATPSRLRRLLARCLQRDPRRRMRDIGEAWIELDAVASGDSEAAPVGAPRDSETQPPAKAGLLARLAWLAIGAIVAGTATWFLSRPGPAPEAAVRRFAIDVGATSPIPVMEVATMIALSPDGRNLAISANRGTGLPSLYVRSLDRLELRPLEGTSFAYAPFFSPDGEWIAFHDPGTRKIKKVPVDGGPVQPLADAYPPLGGTWLDDGTIVFSSGGETSPSLFAVSENGGEVRALIEPAQGETHSYPAALPGSRAVLLSRQAFVAGSLESSIELLDLETETTRRLLTDAFMPLYSHTGHIVFVRQGSLWAVPFDLESLEVEGVEALVQSGVESGLSYTSWALSAHGLMAYAPASDSADGGSMRLAWLDRQGNEEPIDVPTATFADLRVSHDGRKLAILTPDSALSSLDVWIYDLAGRPPIRLTSGEVARSPVWTHDDRAVTFMESRRLNVRTVPIDGSSREGEVLDVSVDGTMGPVDWTPDGQELLVTRGGGPRGQGVNVVVVPKEGEQRPLMDTDFHVTSAVVSPDGNWVAYITNTTGTFELWVRPYPGPGPAHRVSTQGAELARWAQDGRELIFNAGPRLMAATFEPGPEPMIGTPQLLFTRGLARWDLAPDGRILAILPTDVDESRSTRLVLVDGFADELRRLAPPAN